MPDSDDWQTSVTTAETEAPSWQVPNVLGWLNKLNEPIRANYASDGGRLDPLAGMTADDFARKFPKLPTEGVPQLLAQYELSKFLTKDIGRERSPSWMEAIGAGMVGVGKVLEKRHNPNVDASSNPVVERYLAEQGRARDLGLKAQLANAEQLTKAVDQTIVDAAKRAALMRERQEMMKAIDGVAGGGAPAAGAAPVSSAGGGMSLPSLPGIVLSPAARGPAVSSDRDDTDFKRAQIALAYGQKPMGDLYEKRWIENNAAHRAGAVKAAEEAVLRGGPKYVADTELAQAQAREALAGKVIEIDGKLVRVPVASNEAQVVYSGPGKLDATAKKAIDEADDLIMQSNTAIGSLSKALELSPLAYDGWGAKERAALVNNAPSLVKGGLIASDTRGEATQRLDNLIATQTLQTLRATFGGNPTEGERAILLRVAGAVNEPRNVREQIFADAKKAAEARLSFNSQKAELLRAGKYYGPDGQPTSIGQQLADPASRASSGGAPVPVRTPDEARRLPSGTAIVLPDGSIGRVP